MNLDIQAPPILDDITGHVLVVDDEPQNRELLCDLLEDEGHRVSLASDGFEALEQCKSSSFDLILLDVMMPKRDGFEVCAELKSNHETAFIPVLLVTALHDRQSRLRGIRAGANDFITKPIDGQDVVLRARNAVYTKKLYSQLHNKHRQLLEVESLRDDLSSMIVHDMRTPLSAIQMSVDLITVKNKHRIDPHLLPMIERIGSYCRNLTDMASLILDTRRLEEGKMPLNIKTYRLDTIINEVVGMLEPMTKDIGSLNANASGGEAFEVCCDADLIRRVIMNLAANAVKFVSSQTGKVAIDARPNADHAVVSVSDNGPGIPVKFRKKIFSRFGQVEAKRQGRFCSSGLGLTFCKLVVEAHGGKIGVDSKVGKGSTFWFTLKKSR